MATVMDFVRNGGKMVGDVENLLSKVDVIVKENETLKVIVEKQGAVIVSIYDKMGVVDRKLDAIQDEVTASKRTTDEIKHTKFYGQTAKLLPSALEKAKTMSGKEIRKLIHRAALSHPSGRRKGYTAIYQRILEITGVNLYEIGQITLKKSDGIDGWKKDPSYINAILKKGIQAEAAVICMQMLADK